MKLNDMTTNEFSYLNFFQKTYLYNYFAKIKITQIQNFLKYWGNYFISQSLCKSLNIEFTISCKFFICVILCILITLF